MAGIELCDAGHQAIAFIGTCPICRQKHRRVDSIGRCLNVPPLDEGTQTYRPDLDRALQAHYLEVHPEVLGRAVDTHLRRSRNDA